LRQRAAKLEALTTEYKRLEEALRESQEVLHRIFESVTDSTPVNDLDGITRCKPKSK
jgi:PAS domain-containing protein